MVAWLDRLFPRKVLFQSDRRLLHLFLGRVLGSTGFAIVIPFLGLYLHAERGVPMTAVGGIFFFGALTGALGQVVGGDLTDRWGRKVVLVGSQLFRGGVFLALSAAVLLNASIFWFAVLTSLSAFAGRAFEPPSSAMVADIATGRMRVEYYAVLRIGGNLGWAIGPAIGGFLAALSYPSLFLLAAAVLFLSGAFMAVKVAETHPHRIAHAAEAQETTTAAPVPTGTAPISRFGLDELTQTLQNRLFLRYCLVSLLFFTVMAQLISTLSVYAVQYAGITKLELGALYTLNGLMVVFLQFPVVRLLGPFRMTTALVAGSILYAIGYGMMSFGGGLPLLTVAMIVVTSGEIVMSPALMDLVANFSSVELRGRYMGVFGLFNSFGWSIGPLVGGFLIDQSRGRAPLIWGPIAGLMLLGVLGYADVRRRISPEMDRDSGGTGSGTPPVRSSTTAARAREWAKEESQ